MYMFVFERTLFIFCGDRVSSKFILQKHKVLILIRVYTKKEDPLQFIIMC